MPIAKELALKILGALAVGGTVVGGGIALGRSMKGTPKGTDVKDSGGKEEENKPKDQEETGQKTPEASESSPGPTDTQRGDEAVAKVSEVKDPETSKVLEDLGLSCGTDNICTLITGKKLSVKQDKKSETLTSLTSSGEEDDEDEDERKGGKIRFLGTEGEDKKKLTFTIEDGNIWPSWENSSSSITRLEEFETYEVEEETVASGKKYHFKRKAKAIDEMARLLGLTGSGCTLPVGRDNSTKTCQLDKAKLKAINFEGKKESEDPTLGDSETVTLTINKLDSNDDKDYSKYPFKYQFILSGDKEVKIPATPKEIIKKAKDSLGFKIKITPETGGPKTLSLENIPQLERLTGSLGFTDCKVEGSNKTCKFPQKINVYRDDKNSIKGTDVNSWETRTITYEENVDDYEGGIKFTVSSDISVSGGTPKGTISKIEKGDYEIKQQTVDNAKAWYLSKKGK